MTTNPQHSFTHHASTLSDSFPAHHRHRDNLRSSSYFDRDPLPEPPALSLGASAPRGDPASVSLGKANATSTSRSRRDRSVVDTTMDSTMRQNREGGMEDQHSTMKERTSHYVSEYTSTRARGPSADDAVLADAANLVRHEGTAVGAITQLTEIQRIIEERMQSAERTARALSNAKQSINVEGMLTAAQLEAEKWAVSNKGLPSSLSAQEVHAVVAERNNLRLQLRKVAAEIQKVELAAGGKNLDVVRQCQADMDQLARLKSQIELDHDQLIIRLRMLESEVEALKDTRHQLELTVETSEGLLQERNSAILLLHEQLDDLQRKLGTDHALAKENLEKTLKEEQTRFRAEVARERTAAAERTEAAMRAEQFKALDALRADLEQRSDDLLRAKLSEQRDALLAQAAADKSQEMQALQQKLHHENSADMERLRNDMIRDKEASIQAMERKHIHNQERLTQELERLHREGQAKLDRELEEQRKTLENDALFARRAALDKFESDLIAKHKNEMVQQRESLNRRHEQAVQSAVKRQLDAQAKALKAQFNRDYIADTERLKRELKEEYQKKLNDAQTTMQRAQEAAFARRLQQALDEERKRLNRENQRDKAATIEKITAEFRATKARDVAKARETVLAQHEAEKSKLGRQTAKMQSKLNTLRSQTHIEASRDAENATKLKRARIQLRETLRNLQNQMKLALTPRYDVHVDATTNSASEGIAALASLVKDLNKNPPDFATQDEPSIAGTAAPPVSYDILSKCIEELCLHLNTANQNIDDLQVALDSDRKQVRKAVEDEMALAREAEIDMLKVANWKEQELEIDRRLDELRLKHKQELARERKAMEDRLKAVERQAAARQQEQALLLTERLAAGQQDIGMITGSQKRQQQHWENQCLELKKELKKLQGRLKRQGQELIDLRKDNHAMKEGLGTAKFGTMRTGKQTSSAEVRQLRQELGLQEMERLRLEKMVANLRQHVN